MKQISAGGDEDHGMVTFLHANKVASAGYEVYDYDTKVEDSGSTMYTFRVHLTEDNDVIDQTWVYTKGKKGWFLFIRTGDDVVAWKRNG